MVERYALYEIEKLTDRFGLTNGVPKGVKKHYNISPTQSTAVVVQHDGAIKLEMMHWGLVPTGSKDNNSVFRYKTFNIKADKIHSRPATDHAVRHQRCIVPVNGVYMWEQIAGDNVPYFVAARDKRLLALAGIYTTWLDPMGIETKTFSIITTEATKAVPLRHDRMPMILHTTDEKKWLDPTVTDFSSLVQMMRPFDDEDKSLESYEVSPAINSKKIDTPSLLQEASSAN